MLQALGAASSLLDSLQSLTSTNSPGKALGFGQKSAKPFDIFSGTAMSGKSAPASGFEGLPQISPVTMSALLAAQGQSATGASHSALPSKSDVLTDLFAQLDADGDGQVTKLEFENALGAGGTHADRVHSKLDQDGNGTVSLNEMLSALTGARKDGRPSHSATASGESNAPNSSALSKTLQGATTTSVTNSDGSITTSLTYADGSSVTMTSTAAASGSALSSYNHIEKMIQHQARAISSSAVAALSVSA
jgi:hypothetical protein